MQPLLKKLASLTAVLGPIVTLLGLFQSLGWLVGIGGVLICLSIATIVYARAQRRRVEGALIEIEGITIDSVNAANLRRRTNRSLTIQTADHIARIEGADLDMNWRYTGYCRAERETAMEFSVDSANTIPFNEIECFAYDLKRDPKKRCKIRPILIGPDGISKKISVPFLEPIRAEQPFDILLYCRMPAIYKPGIGYYTSTLSFDQDKVDVCTVQLMFLGRKPDWVRAYECDSSGRPRLLKTLRPEREAGKTIEYRDVARDIKGQSIRIYLFQRAETA